MLDIYLIRHAESEGNVNNHLIGGRSNHYKLTERGIEQARKLGKRFREDQITFDHVFSSPAIRAEHTAQIICEEIPHPIESIQYSEHLLELSQGEWEGQLRELHFTAERRKELAQNPWDFAPPGGESQRQVEERMFRWLCEHVIPLKGQQSRVAVVSHGMAIKSLFRKIMDAHPGMTRNTILHNTAVTRLMYLEEKWMIERFNDHFHLNGTGFVDHYG